MVREVVNGGAWYLVEAGSFPSVFLDLLACNWGDETDSTQTNDSHVRSEGVRPTMKECGWVRTGRLRGFHGGDGNGTWRRRRLWVCLDRTADLEEVRD